MRSSPASTSRVATCGGRFWVSTEVHAFARAERRIDTEWPEKPTALVRARLAKLLLDRSEQSTAPNRRLELQMGSANVFLDVGFAAADADDLMERSTLLCELRRLHRRSVAGARCHTIRDVLNRGIAGSCAETLRRALQTARAIEGG